MDRPLSAVVIESSGGVIQDITTFGGKIDTILIDYDDLDPLYDDFTSCDDVRTRVAETLEDLRRLPPGAERQRLRHKAVAAYRETLDALKDSET